MLPCNWHQSPTKGMNSLSSIFVWMPVAAFRACARCTLPAGSYSARSHASRNASPPEELPYGPLLAAASQWNDATSGSFGGEWCDAFRKSALQESG